MLERAKRQLPLVQSPRDRCLFWANSGTTYHALGDMEQAVRHSTIAEALLPEFEDVYLHSACRMNLLLQRLVLEVAHCNGVETPELTELLAAYSSQVERLVAAGQHYPVAKGSEDIADAYIALGQHEKAREALQIGVKSADAAKAGPDRGILELRLGRIERLAGSTGAPRRTSGWRWSCWPRARCSRSWPRRTWRTACSTRSASIGAPRWTATASRRRSASGC